MQQPKFTILAYRGGAGERPENTVAAFEHALSLDTNYMLDLDVRLSRDGVPVVLHDDTLDRTTNGSGAVANYTQEELTRFDAGYRFADSSGAFPFRDRGLRISTLESVLETFPQSRFNVDLRANDGRYPPAIIDVIERCQAVDRVILVSEHDAMVATCRRLRPDWRYGAATNEVRRIVLASRLRLARFVHAPADAFMIPEFHEGRRVLDERLLAELHRRGKQVWVWIVNEPSDATRLRAMGVDGVFTEFPSRMTGLR